MRPHPNRNDTAREKRLTANRLRWIRGILYACTAAFFVGAFIWGTVLLQQGTVTPAVSSVPGAQAVKQLTESEIPLAQSNTTAAPAESGQTPEQTPEQTQEQTPEQTQDEVQATDDVTVECMLSIPSLSLELPVTAYCTDEALLSSVCKFSGPEPGRAGNYVIVGHNFISGAQFAKLDRMQKGEKVILTGKDKKAYTYTVYAFELVTPEDTRALNVPSGSTEVTLLTCAEENTKRLLVRCRMD
jgi:sortase A